MNCDNKEDGKKRTLPICFNSKQLALLEEFAKKKGMTSYNQAVEYIARQNKYQ
jgi:hypothetical protein